MEPFDGTLDGISYWHAKDFLAYQLAARSVQSKALNLARLDSGKKFCGPQGNEEQSCAAKLKRCTKYQKSVKLSRPSLKQAATTAKYIAGNPRENKTYLLFHRNINRPQII